MVIFQKFKNVDVFIIFYDIFRGKNPRQNHFSKKRQGIFEPILKTIDLQQTNSKN